MKYLYHENEAMAALVFAELQASRAVRSTAPLPPQLAGVALHDGRGYASWHSANRACLMRHPGRAASIVRRTLFESDAIRIRSFVAHPVSDACGDVERPSLNVVVLPFAGVFSKHEAPGRHVVGTPSGAGLHRCRHAPIASASQAPSAIGRSSFGSTTPGARRDRWQSGRRNVGVEWPAVGRRHDEPQPASAPPDRSGRGPV